MNHRSSHRIRLTRKSRQMLLAQEMARTFTDRRGVIPGSLLPLAISEIRLHSGLPYCEVRKLVIELQPAQPVEAPIH